LYGIFGDAQWSNDNSPAVEVALADLKTAWNDSLKAEEKFIKIIKNYI